MKKELSRRSGVQIAAELMKLLGGRLSAVMLLAVLFRGNYETIQDLAPLTIAVLGLDVVYIIVLRFFYKQMTYTTDFLLLLILNISVIFQSCFGGIGFAAKHYITCIMALICCQIMFLLTRNHIRLMAIKKYL